MYATKICIRNVKEECSFPQNPLITKLKKRRPSSSSANPRNFGMDDEDNETDDGYGTESSTELNNGINEPSTSNLPKSKNRPRKSPLNSQHET